MSSTETQAAAHFNAKGYCVASDFVRPAELKLILAAADSILPDQVRLSPTDIHQRTLLEFSHSENWRSRIEPIISTKIVSTLGAQFFRRTSPMGTPPHRDADYLPGRRVLCLWLALEDVISGSGVMLRPSRQYETVSLQAGSALLFHGGMLHKIRRPSSQNTTRLSLVTHFELIQHHE